jgi:hypothetical protein
MANTSPVARLARVLALLIIPLVAPLLAGCASDAGFQASGSSTPPGDLGYAAYQDMMMKAGMRNR